jgi:hypothetical protein
MPAVIAAAVIAAAPWFAVWFAAGGLFPGWLSLGSSPGSGSSISWYRVLTAWAGLHVTALPIPQVTSTPVTLPGLTLLWLVPVLITTGRRQQPPESALRVGPALTAGLAGGLAVALAGVLLPYATRAALPLSVRYSGTPSPSAWPATFTYFSVYCAVAVLAQAIVAAVVAARTRQHRPAMTALAVSLTAALAAVALQALSLPISRCIHLFSATPGPCLTGPGLGRGIHFAASALGQITVDGIILAVPAALAGAAVGTWARRHGRMPSATTPRARIIKRPARSRPRLARTAVITTISLLTATSAFAAWLTLPDDRTAWAPLPTRATAPARPGPTPRKTGRQQRSAAAPPPAAWPAPTRHTPSR